MGVQFAAANRPALGAAASPLARWSTATASSSSTPAKALVIGASFVEGQGASVRVGARWLDKFRAALQANHPSGAVGGYGYLPSYYGVYGPDSTWGNWQDSSSGTVTLDSSVPSLGFRTAIMAAGAGRTYSFVGTDLDIWYAKRSDAGSFSWSIDGGSATAVSGTGTASVANRVQVTGLTQGPHTVTIAATGKTYLEGFTAYSGDRSKGVQVIDSGHTGAYTPQVNALDSTFTDLLNLHSPDLVILTDTSLNDATNGDSVSTVIASTQTLINRILGLTKVPSILLVADYQPSSMGTAPSAWSAYVTALSSLAVTNGAAFLDLTAVMPTATTAGTGLYRTDGLHPNDSGHTAVAGYVANALKEMFATAAPTVTGTTSVGSVLTASAGTYVVTPDSVTYQWLRNGSPISGATSSTYTLVSADDGTQVGCVVTALKSGYTSAVATPTVAVGAVILFSENFPGTSGAALPSSWTTLTGGTGSSVQQTGSNGARLTASTAGYTQNATAYRNDTSAANVSFLFDVAFSNPSVEQYCSILLRASTPVTSGATISGVYLQLFPGNGANSGGVNANNGSGETGLSGDLALGAFTANVFKRFRFEVTGTTVRVRTWAPGATEPSTWFWTGTTSITGAGRVVLAQATGSTVSNPAATFQNLYATAA